MQASDPRRAAASVAMFERLADHWSLRGDEREMLLGGIVKSTWSEWRQRPAFARLKSDTRERIANLFTIDLNAHSLFAPEFADRWVREPNAAFGGQSPLAAMLRGKVEDIITVRRYLERVRTSSPADELRASAHQQPEAAGMSLLPGDAFEPDRYDAMAALRRAVALYERRAAEDAPRYEPMLAAALDAYATALIDDRNAEAVTILLSAIEMFRRLARGSSAYEDELLRNLLRLSAVQRTLGNEGAAYALLEESREIDARRRKDAVTVEVMRERVFNHLIRDQLKDRARFVELEERRAARRRRKRT
jgi:hypothetical protein